MDDAYSGTWAGAGSTDADGGGPAGADRRFGRRGFIRGVGGLGAAAMLGGAVSSCASSPSGSTGAPAITVLDHQTFGRMEYYRVRTPDINWDPGVNVLLPDGYWANPSTRYPVMYLLHGGLQDFRKFDFEDDIRGLTAGRNLIVVMPDGGAAGWYTDPVSSLTGNRNWETFHIKQLIPWVDANFRTYAEADGRAVSGFSMGGFGALKYMTKYPNLFGSVGSHSGPASLRRDGAIVVQWANLSAATVELAGGSMYGSPLFNEAKVSADNPVEHVASFWGKRVMLVCGLAGETSTFDINETFVKAGHQEFRGLLNQAGIAHESYELPGGHFVRREMLQADIDGAIAKLKKA